MTGPFSDSLGEARAHLETMWSEDGASAGLGIEAIEVRLEEGLGRARTRMLVREDMVNGHAIMHGGLIFTLADSTFALACNTCGQTTVAAGCDIDFLAPARLGDVLLAEGTERARYGRNGLTDVTVRRESDGTVIAEMRGRSRTVRRD